MTTETGIHSSAIRETPIAVLDVETTGLMPKRDRVIEIAVAKYEHGTPVRFVFETLIDPEIPVTATEIHGITQDHVKGAPRFKEIAGDLLKSLSGCVVAAYNASFDINFIRHELRRLNFDIPLPFVCLMDIRPMLGISSSRCKLQDACCHHGINMRAAHVASADLQAAARLLGIYMELLEEKDIDTFGQLLRLRSTRNATHRIPRFLQSFDNAPLPDISSLNLQSCENLVTRYDGESLIDLDSERYALISYNDALQTALADLEITDEELDYLQKERTRVQLTVEQERALHARFFASAISEFIDDDCLDEMEAQKLQRLYRCLSKLGWAPGT